MERVRGMPSHAAWPTFGRAGLPAVRPVWAIQGRPLPAASGPSARIAQPGVQRRGGISHGVLARLGVVLFAPKKASQLDDRHSSPAATYRSPQESIDYVANATLRLNVLLTCMERTSELSSRFTGTFKILLILLSTKFDGQAAQLYPNVT